MKLSDSPGKDRMSNFGRWRLLLLVSLVSVLVAAGISSGADRTISGGTRPPGLLLTPTLGTYLAKTISLNANTSVMPDMAPLNTASMTVSSSTNFKGTLEGDPVTGAVRITNAHPAGNYSIAIKAFSSSGETAEKTFGLTINTAGSCDPVAFAPPTSYATGAYPFSVAVGDFNGDGNQDLVLTITYNFFGTILLGDGTGHFNPATHFATGSYPGSVAVGDFNGDGKQDLTVTNYYSDYVSVFMGNGTGDFAAVVAQTITVGFNAHFVAVGDFNGDGKEDLVVSKFVPGNNVLIFLGDGTGHFSANATLSAASSAVCVAVGDFNGDGKQDLATANRDSSNVSIFLGNGAGGFGSRTDFDAGVGPWEVRVGDFNGDSKQDLAVSNLESNNVSVFLGDGTGGFAPAQTIPVGERPTGLAIGDFNGDNKQDLVVSNNSSNNVSILLGEGTGYFRDPTNLGAGIYPWGVAVGDFNGDAKQDLAVASFGSYAASILLQDCNDCTLCHKNTITINVPCNSSEYQRHLDHGDVIGPCPSK